jgi:hypothetical protein
MLVIPDNVRDQGPRPIPPVPKAKAGVPGIVLPALSEKRILIVQRWSPEERLEKVDGIVLAGEAPERVVNALTASIVKSDLQRRGPVAKASGFVADD